MEYSVIYSKRRTLCLQIKGDYTILVKAPYGISQEKIASFVSSHKGWIEKAIRRLESKPKIDNLTKEEILNALNALSDSEKYGMILRAKGIVECECGSFIHFDYVPGEPDVRTGSASVTGRLCVIGSKINEDALKELFNI